MLVLGVETSCDETGVALYHTEQGLLGHCVHTQAPMHAEYGGVVPELASRDHVRKLLPLLENILEKHQLQVKDIDAVAYTAGPGLVGALFVGATFARSLAWALAVPAVAVHHMEGHLLAPMLCDNPPDFPFVALLVSGGHTQLVDVAGVGQYTLLGASVDDAAGEAFDKTAKLLGLGYPGGPALAALAEQGDASRFTFPRPMCDRPGLEFSFSGLKTHVANTLRKTDATDQDKADIAAGFERAVVETLVIKCKRALQMTKHDRLVVAGGVSANVKLRSALDALAVTLKKHVAYPPHEFCGDNGAMIALAGALRLSAGVEDNLQICVRPRWPMDELDAPGSTQA